MPCGLRVRGTAAPRASRTRPDIRDFP